MIAMCVSQAYQAQAQGRVAAQTPIKRKRSQSADATKCQRVEVHPLQLGAMELCRWLLGFQATAESSQSEANSASPQRSCETERAQEADATVETTAPTTALRIPLPNSTVTPVARCIAEPPGLGKIRTFHHRTSQEKAAEILRSYVESGSKEWCKSDVNFNVVPSKAGSTESVLVQVKVNMGKVAHLDEAGHGQSYDAIAFHSGDGPEHLVWSSSGIVLALSAARIVSMKQVS